MAHRDAAILKSLDSSARRRVNKHAAARVVDHVEPFLNSSALPSECNGAPQCCHFIVVGRRTMVPPTPNSSARCWVLSMMHRNAIMFELWQGTL